MLFVIKHIIKFIYNSSLNIATKVSLRLTVRQPITKIMYMLGANDRHVLYFQTVRFGIMTAVNDLYTAD